MCAGMVLHIPDGSTLLVPWLDAVSTLWGRSLLQLRAEHAYDRIATVQAISAAEEEAAKKKVGSAAALKQLEKLRKEAAKTSKEAEKVSEELLARKEEHKVNNKSQKSWAIHASLAEYCLAALMQHVEDR